MSVKATDGFEWIICSERFVRAVQRDLEAIYYFKLTFLLFSFPPKVWNDKTWIKFCSDTVSLCWTEKLLQLILNWFFCHQHQCSLVNPCQCLRCEACLRLITRCFKRTIWWISASDWWMQNGKQIKHWSG